MDSIILVMWAEILILKECHTIQGIKSKNKNAFFNISSAEYW
jgi:predicted NUDIX family phosphoesterase